MKMKRWLNRMVGREDWASRALRLGLEAFDRESLGTAGRARPVSRPWDQAGAGPARNPLGVDAESVPTIP
jgi:hypothetical protein